MLDWYLALSQGDKIALVSLIVTLVGTVIGVITSLVQSRQAKGEALKANKAVKKAREDINIAISISEAASVLSPFNDLIQICVDEAWIKFPGVSDSIRGKLASLARHPEMDTDKLRIEAILVSMQEANVRVNAANQKGIPPTRKTEIHLDVIRARDDIIGALTTLQRKVGR